MRMIFPRFLILAALPAIVLAQVPAGKPQVWIGPPGVDEGRALRAMFERPDEWKQTRPMVDVLLYADHSLRKFSDDDLRRWFGMLREWNIKLALEVGAIKEWGQTGDEAFRRQYPSWDRFQNLGAKIYAISMDEPLLCARKHINKSDEYALDETVKFISLVRRRYPDMLVGDIETYPSIPLPDHYRWIENLERRLRERNVRNIDFYRLDVNWINFTVQQTGAWKEVRQLEQYCRGRKLPFSLIYWPADLPLLRRLGRAGDSTWYVSIMRQAQDYAALGGAPDQYVIESWVGEPSEAVPDSAAWTFTRSVLDFVPRFVFPAVSAEWGQWGGPDRNFKVPARPLPAKWPADGPKVRWKHPLPYGNSSVAVDGNRLYTMYRDGDNEVVLALQAGTGKTAWEYKYPAVFLKGMNMATGPGPHSTPLIAGDRLYTVGVTGKLHCLDKQTGKVLWTRGLIEEMGGNVMLRGYSNSPLLYRDTVIVMLGGAGHTIAALDLVTGATRWQGGDFNNSHSSPMLIRGDGEEQVACVVEKAVAGFDPASGRVLWSHPHENRGGDITSTLLWGPGNLLFFSGAYQGGSRTLQLNRVNGKTQVKELWFHRQLRIHHSDAVRIGNYVYASNGDFGGTLFLCVDIRTGEIKWRERAIPRANTLLIGERALILDEDGVLHWGTLSPDGWKESSRFQILQNLAWTPPSIGGNVLYLRDRKSIAAVELK